MFLHNLKYACLQIIRDKTEIFWILAFPIILSTLFKAAFGNLYTSGELFSSIPVAIVTDSSAESETFLEVADSLSSSDDPLLKVTKTENNDAQKLLDNADVDGIIYATKDDVTLTVKENDINQSILKSVTDSYLVNKKVIEDIAASDPQNIQKVVDSMSEEITYNNEINLSHGERDFFVQYFYNLIAMVCVFACSSGVVIVVRNQGNLSAIGARVSASPTGKFIKLFAGFVASVIINTVIMMIVLAYMILALKINFGDNIPAVLLGAFAGIVMGTSMGIFIGSIGNMKENVKNAITTALILFCCVLSGLMADNIPRMIQKNCPIVNRLNPVAIVSDCFYTLSVYDTYERFYMNIAKLLILSVVFMAGSFMFLRRKKYASI
ncbi:MAG: ABC transporter permease [Oscillospiraceae bacterium]|nr:ABC transporter permease [Oscillospiraceae bacterium]